MWTLPDAAGEAKSKAGKLAAKGGRRGRPLTISASNALPRIRTLSEQTGSSCESLMVALSRLVRRTRRDSADFAAEAGCQGGRRHSNHDETRWNERTDDGIILSAQRDEAKSAPWRPSRKFDYARRLLRPSGSAAPLDAAFDFES